MFFNIFLKFFEKRPGNLYHFKDKISYICLTNYKEYNYGYKY